MKVVIDAMGAPAGSGGMQLYARELIAAWIETWPQDQLVVVGGEWLAREFAGERVRVVTIRRAGVVTRIATQCIISGVLFWRCRADALLSLSAVASPLVPVHRRAVVIHDWRHLTRPEEFGRAQRVYRRLWKRSIGAAGLVIAISEKTVRETERFARPRRLELVRNGGDHPRRWTRQSVDASGPRGFVTFGHLPNKRPELAIDAIAELAGRGQSIPLTVLGASGGYRAELAARAAAGGVSELIHFPGFVDDETYQHTIMGARGLLVTSSDEGFGLPVVEANYFGVPVIVTDDSGLSDIHARVISVAPTPSAVAAAIERVGTVSGVQQLSDAPDTQWSDTVTTIRGQLASLHEGSRPRNAQ